MMAKILIVDDFRPLRRLLKATLADVGHQVVEAEDGFQALAIARGERFDLVLTDVTMPNLDGIGLLRLMKAMPDYQRVPILLLTRSEDDEQREKALALGATAWMVKPFSPELLLSTIDRALTRPRPRLDLGTPTHQERTGNVDRI